MSDEARRKRAAIADETRAILESGRYRAGDTDVDIRAALAAALRGTEALSPAAMEEVLERARRRAATVEAPLRIEVTGESTVSAARRLSSEHRRVACLNFASARRPGGGFVTGARAQEESVCRASGLYATLIARPEYYEANRACHELYYTDWAIYSPDVPVIRDDSEQLVREPFTASFVTMPAPNRGGGGRLDDRRVADTLRRRIAMVLALCSDRGHDALVLGAWGCGAFGNDARAVAPLFREALQERALSLGIERIVFAVLDSQRDRDNRAAFEDALGDPCSPPIRADS
jgi:uncharacterized protein (TIGR02452 family)